MVHTFCATDYNLTAIWYSNGTLQLQGTYADTVENKISALIRSKTSGEPNREILSKVAKLKNDLSKLRKLVLELRDDKLDLEQLDSVTEHPDQPKITDFFKPVSPEVQELASNRDRAQDLERRLKEAELLKVRLEKENDNLRAKNAELRRRSRRDSAADSSIPRTTKESGVKV